MKFELHLIGRNFVRAFFDTKVRSPLNQSYLIMLSNKAINDAHTQGHCTVL